MRHARRALALSALMLLAMPAAGQDLDPPPVGELVLDLDAPIIDATIAGVPLRLLVALDGRDGVELNPDAAARLAIPFEDSSAVEVGRVVLQGRRAQSTGVIGGRTVPLTIETHGVRCCMASDGTIAPEALPYARIRFVRAGAPSARTIRFPAAVSAQAGLAGIARIGGETIAVKLAPAAAETVATGAAGSILAQAAGGRWDGPARGVPLAFGVVRPVRPLRLGRMIRLLGLPVETVMVRTADFRGARALPGDPDPPGEIMVKGRVPPAQHEWIAVALGKPQLDRCTEIAIERVPALAIALRCADAIE